MSSPEGITSNAFETETIQDSAQRAKRLVTDIFDCRYNFGEMSIVEGLIQEQLIAIPREALVMAAWHGIANYHRELAIWGDPTRFKRQKEEKEYRKSLLQPDELERAINLANNWLDDSFGK